MNIGLVCPYKLDSPGGVKEHVLGLHQEFKKLGHQVKILAPGESKIYSNPDFIVLGQGIRVPTPNNSWALLSLYLGQKTLGQVLQEYHFDILHFHEPLAPFLCWQILNQSLSTNIATFHSSWDQNNYSLNSLRVLLEPLQERFKKRFSGVIAVSPVTKNCWGYFFDGKVPSAIIPNGIDTKRFNPEVKPSHQWGLGLINILFVGRLERRKGVFYLLKAFEKLYQKKKNVRLTIVGSGPQRLPAQIWVKAHQLEDAILFEGSVPDEKIPFYYTGADIFCSPAIGGESFGIVLLEAMASGVPIVAFANPGYKEVLKNIPGKVSLVPVQDVSALTESLLKLSQDKSLREKLRNWGQNEVQRYSWEKVARRVLDFYQKLLP